MGEEDEDAGGMLLTVENALLIESKPNLFESLLTSVVRLKKPPH